MHKIASNSVCYLTRHGHKIDFNFDVGDVRLPIVSVGRFSEKQGRTVYDSREGNAIQLGNNREELVKIDENFWLRVWFDFAADGAVIGAVSQQTQRVEMKALSAQATAETEQPTVWVKARKAPAEPTTDMKIEHGYTIGASSASTGRRRDTVSSSRLLLYEQQGRLEHLDNHDDSRWTYGSDGAESCASKRPAEFPVHVAAKFLE